MSGANLLQDIPDDLTREVIEVLACATDLRIERIVSRGHCTPAQDWYDQDLEEWVLVLRGAGIIGFDDGSELRLGPGEHILIPAHRRHRVLWTDPTDETIWLAVHFRR